MMSPASTCSPSLTMMIAPTGEAVDRGGAGPRRAAWGSPFSSQTETDGRKLVVRYSMMVMDAWCVASSSFS